MPPHPERIRALTLDLDDTLWPVWPTILRAEAALATWLAARAPRAAARFDLAATRALRARVADEHPQWAHDLSAQRRETIRRMLASADEDEALADAGFEVFFAERQRVEFYADALPALERLAARWPLLALSNGNADVGRVGIARWFAGSLSAQQVGAGKPDRRIFAAACGQLGCAPHQVLHVGDDLALDIRGALDAGLQAAWVRRDDAALDPALRCWQGPDLLSLAQHLGA